MKKLIIVSITIISQMLFGVFAAFSDDFYTETLGRAATDIRNVKNANDCMKIESYLRDAERQCVTDPKCDRRTLEMLNKAIDAVQKMYK